MDKAQSLGDWVHHEKVTGHVGSQETLHEDGEEGNNFDLYLKHGFNVIKVGEFTLTQMEMETTSNHTRTSPLLCIQIVKVKVVSDVRLQMNI